MKTKSIFTFFTCSLFLSFHLYANVPASNERGMTIANKMKSLNEGFVGEESEMKMTLIDAYGAKAIREMQGKVMEVDDDGDKSLSIFLNPKDVKGTKMLTWSHKEDDDDQWLYLPVSKRLRRISSRSKSSSFMGSEFSYEDLGSQEIEKYNFVFEKEGSLEGKKVFIVARYPKSKSGYSKQVMFIDQTLYHPHKIEYYDRKGELLKVAVFKNYQEHTVNDKKMYRVSEIEMSNVQTKKKSLFTWSKRKLGVKHSDRTFDKKALQK